MRHRATLLSSPSAAMSRNLSNADIVTMNADTGISISSSSMPRLSRAQKQVQAEQSGQAAFHKAIRLNNHAVSLLLLPVSRSPSSLSGTAASTSVNAYDASAVHRFRHSLALLRNILIDGSLMPSRSAPSSPQTQSSQHSHGPNADAAGGIAVRGIDAAHAVLSLRRQQEQLSPQLQLQLQELQLQQLQCPVAESSLPLPRFNDDDADSNFFAFTRPILIPEAIGDGSSSRSGSSSNGIDALPMTQTTVQLYCAVVMLNLAFVYHRKAQQLDGRPKADEAYRHAGAMYKKVLVCAQPRSWMQTQPHLDPQVTQDALVDSSLAMLHVMALNNLAFVYRSQRLGREMYKVMSLLDRVLYTHSDRLALMLDEDIVRELHLNIFFCSSMLRSSLTMSSPASLVRAAGTTAAGTATASPATSTDGSGDHRTDNAYSYGRQSTNEEPESSIDTSATQAQLLFLSMGMATCASAA